MCYLRKFAPDESRILQHTLIRHGGHESTFSMSLYLMRNREVLHTDFLISLLQIQV